MSQESKLDLLLKVVEENERKRVAVEERTRADFADLKKMVEARLPVVEKKVETLSVSVQSLSQKVELMEGSMLKYEPPTEGIGNNASWLAAEDATWEDLEELRARFPTALAWGQAKFQGEGIVKEQAVPGDVPLTEDGEKNSNEAEDRQAGAMQSKGGNLRHTTRPVKQNPKYCWPNWAM
ncbi:uncharacterized protein LOC127775508 [Oryza glaberrima]|uniref:uncharacterized protein LOC127775508 n=1 Tax=Oryza glaberrima TaxID=4538 RepID=UPI00224C48ED|nr:uncharacterized protein LOC127775508 [Oryza glaberrima]